MMLILYRVIDFYVIRVGYLKRLYPRAISEDPAQSVKVPIEGVRRVRALQKVKVIIDSSREMAQLTRER